MTLAIIDCPVTTGVRKPIPLLVALLFLTLWLGADAGIAANQGQAEQQRVPTLSTQGSLESIKSLGTWLNPEASGLLAPIGNSAIEASETERIEDIYARAKAESDRWSAISGAGDKVRLVNLAWAEEVEAFVNEKPNSAWTPALKLQLGSMALQRFAFSKADLHLGDAYLSAADSLDPTAISIARESARLHSKLLALSGRLSDFDALYKVEVQKDEDSVRLGWHSAIELRSWIQRYPEEAYKCGLQSLDNLGRLTQPDKYNPNNIYMRLAQPKGFSVGELVRIGTEVGLDVRAVAIDGTDELPYPSVAHFGFEHFVIIRQRDGAFYEVLDPATSRTQWLTPAELEDELTGVFIVAGDTVMPRAGGARSLSADEAGRFLGKCYHGTALDWQGAPPCDSNCPCPEGSSGPNQPNGKDCSTCSDASSGRPSGLAQSLGATPGTGMPIWWINEPYINLWISDTPLSYQPALGPRVHFTIRFSSRSDLVSATITKPSSRIDGGGYSDWTSSWISWINYDSASGNAAVVFRPLGGRSHFSFTSGATTSNPDYWTRDRLQKVFSGANLVGFRLLAADGSKLEYLQKHATHQNCYMMTSEADRLGYQTTFGYLHGKFLSIITASDGTTFHVSHEYQADVSSNTIYESRITQISGSNGYSAVLGYNEAGAHPTPGVTSSGLSSITDTEGIKSYLYARIIGENHIVTPYGRTSFLIEGQGQAQPGTWEMNEFERTAEVFFPDGSKQAYAALSKYQPSPNDWPGWPAGAIPDTIGAEVQTLDTTERQSRNTYFWSTAGRAVMTKPVLAQAGTLGSINWADLRAARIRHWLTHTEDAFTHWGTLSWEQDPSPDGVSTSPPAAEGAVTWYDYPGKPNLLYSNRGTSPLPAVIARRMPDGTSQWISLKRNFMGMVQERKERWTSGGAPQTRTEEFSYDASGIDLVWHKGPGGNVLAGYAYNQSLYPGLPIRTTNALGQSTAYIYDSTTKRLLEETFPNGLIRTYTYYGAADPANNRHRLKRVVERSTAQTLATEDFSWLGGQLRTHTDAMGLVRTFTVDSLGRLRRVDYPDATFEEHKYQNENGVKFMDKLSFRDRRGFTTRWTYDGRQRVLTEIDGDGHKKVFTYCLCGDAPATIAAELSPSVSLVETRTYDKQGRLTERLHPEGSKERYWYNALGWLTTYTNSFGTNIYYYDNLGRVTAISTAVATVYAATYDLEDRILSETDENGVTQQLSYDLAGRLVSASRAGGVALEQWTYNVAGLSIEGPVTYVNPRGITTRFTYDVLGRILSEGVAGYQTNAFLYSPSGKVTGLVDGNGSQTTWAYNSESQLQSKTYHGGTSPSVNYTYHPGGLTASRTVAGKGTTTYSYDGRGNLTSVVYPAGTPSVGFTVDPVGRTATMTDGLGTTTFTYSLGGGRTVIREDGPWAGAGDVVAVTNVMGRSIGTEITQPSGAWRQAVIYNQGRVSSVSSPAGAFTYSYTNRPGANGYLGSLVRTIAVPTTGTASYRTNWYDAMGRLAGTAFRLADALGTTRSAHSYLMDGMYRTRMTRRDGSFVNYTYDNGGQLTSAVGTGGESVENHGYSYDWSGNRTGHSVNGVTRSYLHNGLNQMIEDGQNDLVYDQAGNLVSESGPGVVKTYEYDAESRMIAVEAPGSWRTEFKYDGFGRMRVRREYSWTPGTGGCEIHKGQMTASASSDTSGWLPANSINTSTADPGWHNSSYQEQFAYLRIDLQSPKSVGRVAYQPRLMNVGSDPYSDPSWNGVFRDYAIYVSNNGSGDPSQWGTPVAAGTWTWPSGSERRDITFVPKTGQYVYFVRLSSYGWYAQSHYGFASANEVWVYESGSGQQQIDEEIPKGPMVFTASSSTGGWAVGQAKDGLTVDPGWHNDSSTENPAFIRMNLGSQQMVSKVAYLPRQMNPTADPYLDSSWNGVYKDFAIYVCNSGSNDSSTWGAPVATGTWTWTPGGQEIRQISFTPKLGQYVYVVRVSAYGWYGNPGPGFASANELWVYRPISVSCGGTPGTWSTPLETQYLYDGWRVMQERNGSGTPLVAYTRGPDLSGTLERAGGIGGLLARSRNYSSGTWGASEFYADDGNGNVVGLVDQLGAERAAYRYDPFGGKLFEGGDLAGVNRVQFSSKEWMQNSGLHYYGRRFYSAGIGRWPNRDPIEEDGGLNLYQFCHGSPLNVIDPFGLEGNERCEEKCPKLESQWPATANAGQKIPSYVGRLIIAVDAYRNCVAGCNSKYGSGRGPGEDDLTDGQARACFLDCIKDCKQRGGKAGNSGRKARPEDIEKHPKPGTEKPRPKPN